MSEAPTLTQSDHSPAPQEVFEPTWKDNLDINPYVVYARHAANKLGRIGTAVSEDLSELDDKELNRTKAWLGATLVTQALDRARIVIITAPPTAISVLEHTGSNTAAAATAAGMFAVWNGSMGEVLTRTLARFPKGVDEFSEQFPSTVELFTASLPGIEGKNAEQSPTEPEKGRLATIRSKLGLHARRALTGFGIGSTAFVATASANGQSTEEVRKTNLAVTGDTSAFVFGVAYGVAASISQLGETHPVLAHDIQEGVGNSKLWLGIAALSMTAEYMANKSKRAAIRAEAGE